MPVGTWQPCVPGNEMDKMADSSTVVFSGSSTETIENAKAFWMAVDPPLKPKSTLVVSGISHRLLTAPTVENGL